MELHPMQKMKEACEEIAATNPENVNKLASNLNKMVMAYYEEVKSQAKKSFYSALGVALFGVVIIISTIYVDPTGQGNLKTLGVVAGILTEFISGINFYLYSKAARQFASFHICLERTSRYLLANAMCEHISDNNQKDKTREELIRVIANAPLLTIDDNDPVAMQATPSKELANGVPILTHSN